MELHIPVMNFLSIFKLLQIRLPFIQTVFYASVPASCPYLITAPPADSSPAAAPGASAGRGGGGRGRRALPPGGSRLAAGGRDPAPPPRALRPAAGKQDRLRRCLRSQGGSACRSPSPSASDTRHPIRPGLFRSSATRRALLPSSSDGSGVFSLTSWHRPQRKSSSLRAPLQEPHLPT